MMTKVKLTSGGMITIPAVFREKYELKPGDSIAVIESPDGLLLIPVVPLDKLQDSSEVPIAREICNDLIEEHRREQQSE